jgi:HEAT repeat protein
VGFVARFPSEDVLSTLESIARNEQNEMVRRSAARNLVGYPSPRARQVVRSLIEDNTISDDIRTEMLDRYNEERGTAEDAAWLRLSFAKVTSQSVKRSIVGAVGRIGGADSQKWLMDLSSNDQESASIRSEAFRRVSKSMTVPELGKAYDAAGSRPMRQSIVSALNSRKEPEAVEKLIDIVRKGTDPEIRRSVIQMLTDRKDPKITALLIELIDR